MKKEKEIVETRIETETQKLDRMIEEIQLRVFFKENLPEIIKNIWCSCFEDDEACLQFLRVQDDDSIKHKDSLLYWEEKKEAFEQLMFETITKFKSTTFEDSWGWR